MNSSLRTYVTRAAVRAKGNSRSIYTEVVRESSSIRGKTRGETSNDRIFRPIFRPTRGVCINIAARVSNFTTLFIPPMRIPLQRVEFPIFRCDAGHIHIYIRIHIHTYRIHRCVHTVYNEPSAAYRHTLHYWYSCRFTHLENSKPSLARLRKRTLPGRSKSFIKMPTFLLICFYRFIIWSTNDRSSRRRSYTSCLHFISLRAASLSASLGELQGRVARTWQKPVP